MVSAALSRSRAASSAAAASVGVPSIGSLSPYGGVGSGRPGLVAASSAANGYGARGGYGSYTTGSALRGLSSAAYNATPLGRIQLARAEGYAPTPGVYTPKPGYTPATASVYPPVSAAAAPLFPHGLSNASPSGMNIDSALMAAAAAGYARQQQSYATPRSYGSAELGPGGLRRLSRRGCD